MITLYRDNSLLHREFEFTIKPITRERCKDFAKRFVITTEKHHQKRGQFDQEVRIIQATEGKIAEFAAYDLFANYLKVDCTKPDVQIYDDKTKIKKSFDSDLKVVGNKCHVKSQPAISAKRFGTSWMFQYADETGNIKSGHRDREIFDDYSDDDFCCFIVMDQATAYILACPKVKTLHEKKLFDLPKKITLHNSKRVVYLDQLKTIGEDLMWEGVEKFL